MAWTPIDLVAGLSSDDTPLALEGRFRNANNVRFHKGRAEITAGWERLSTAELSGVCRNVLIWAINGVSTQVAFGTHTHLLVHHNGELADITPEGLAPGLENGTGGGGWGVGPWGVGAWGATVFGDYYPRTWALANWGQDLVAAPRGGALYTWSANAGGEAARVAEAPARSNYMLVTAQRQVVLFGTEEEISGDHNHMCIRGCDFEKLHAWNVTTSNNAFEDVLEGSGRIVAARNFGDGLIVWTGDRAWLGTFVGGAGQTYRWAELHGAPGLLGPNAAVVTRDAVMWLSPDRLLYTLPIGTAAPLLIDCPVHADSLGEFLKETQADKVVLSYTRQTNSVRIDYPDLRDAGGRENSRYLVLNLSDGSWSRGAQARSAFDGGLTNPIGIEPKLNVAPNIGFEADFASSIYTGPGVPGVTVDGLFWGGGVLTKHDGYLLMTVQGPDGVLTISDLALDGSKQAYVEIDLRRKTARGSGVAEDPDGGAIGGGVPTPDVPPWRGTVEFSWSDAGDGGYGSISQAVSDVEVGERRVLRWEMNNLASEAGGPWIGHVIDEVQIRLDSYAGGEFHVYGVRIIGEPVATPSTSVAYYHERGTNADGGPITWSLETNYFALDEDETSMLVRGMKPDFKDQAGTVNLTIFMKDVMGSRDVEQVYGPYPLMVGQGRLDLLAAGKLARFKLEGSSAPASLRLGKSLFDVVPLGTR